MRVEIWIGRASMKATRILEAMARSAPRFVSVDVTDEFRGRADALMLWGSRRSDHMIAWSQMRARGARCIGFDLGFWDRPNSVRLHVDEHHTTPEQLAQSPSQSRRTFELREDADPNGPIMLVGIGQKSLNAERAHMGDWERSMYVSLRREFPNAEIEWRPKYSRVLAQPLPDKRLKLAPDVPIDEGLRGRRLAVCRHSNVAVDACVAGVPVRCTSGAAHALYARNERPSREERADFLARLSWWNWNPEEAKEIWKFLLTV